MINRLRGLALHWQILIAIVAAAIVGEVTRDMLLFGAVTWYSVFDFFGTLFINALKMLIVPLISSSIIVGVAGIGASGHLGRLGGKTLLFYALTTLFAILLGLLLVNLVQPGILDGQPVGALLALDANSDAVLAQVGNKGLGDIVQIFVRMVPTNIVQAAAEGSMLGIIFFCLLFGFFMSQLEEGLAETLFRFWSGVFQVMMKMTEWVMKFAPIGVFGLVARVVSKTGFDAATPLLLFAVVVLIALLLHVLVTLPLLLRWVGGVSPFATLKVMSPAMLTAFSTASSSATLPVTMDCLEKRAGVSNRISSFVLPLGATVNMNGTALYECMAAMFLAQAYGLDLSFSIQFSIVVIALITSIGVAGIPSASLVAIAIILAAVGLPVEAIAVLFVFDRVLDMARTSVNVFGDASCAVIVARLEGEETSLGRSA
ncbi:MAG: dicarboxylate/amino acid:cation symporter [Gammaproteobacteria bacterium]|nr:dicarboxylate/amino acid:cation symporter [Gammaproteobacteria bacterium]